jgi:hypothetical protein
MLTFLLMISSNPVAARSRYATFLLLVPFALLGFSAASAPSPTSATSAPAAPTSTQALARETAAQKHIDQRLQFWQERLNLKDWNIKARLVDPSALEPKTLGNIRWDTDARTATIGVLSTQNYQLPYQAMLDDMEFTIVHELVHLHLASLPRSDASRRVEEHAVNELAKALLNLAKR